MTRYSRSRSGFYWPFFGLLIQVFPRFHRGIGRSSDNLSAGVKKGIEIVARIEIAGANEREYFCPVTETQVENCTCRE